MAHSSFFLRGDFDKFYSPPLKPTAGLSGPPAGVLNLGQHNNVSVRLKRLLPEWDFDDFHSSSRPWLDSATFKLFGLPGCYRLEAILIYSRISVSDHPCRNQ